jgi:serine/threonine-protein kinase
MVCAHCGATHAPEAAVCPRTDRPLSARGPCGQIIDRYRVDALLGVGGFGSVYRGRHVHTNRAVAIKILRADLAADGAMLARFKREAQTIAAIDSPHVVQVLDWGALADGDAYLVMELLAGHDLKTELAHKGPLAVDRALELVRQILSALDAVHARRAVHRDLKPANVFLVDIERRDWVKVIDFGISKLRGPTGMMAAVRTELDMSFGTPGYMAPEQIRGSDVDQRADVFAAAAILFEMLAGDLPYGRVGYEDYVMRVWRGSAQSIRELVPAVPERLEAAIACALERDPAARWPTAAAFAEALGVELAASAAPTPPREPVPDGAEPTRRDPPRRRRVWLAIAGAVVVGAGTAAAVRAVHTDDDPAPIGELVVQPAATPAPAPHTTLTPPPTVPPAPLPPPQAVDAAHADPHPAPRPHKRASTFEHTAHGAPVETDLGKDR